MSVRKFRKSWWVDITIKGKRHRKRSPKNTKEEAKDYEATLRKDKSLNEDKSKQKQRFEVFAWDWFKTCAVPHNKHSEIKRKKYTLGTNLIPFFGDIPLNKITVEHIDRYKAQKQTDGMNPKTTNNHLSVLRTCLNVAKEWYGLEKLPKVKLFRVSPPGFSFLIEKECELLLSQLSGVWYEIVLVAIKTGLRMGELQGLQWSDVNWNTKVLTVRRSWCECKNGLTTTKSGKERHIPLTSDLYEMLYRKRKEDGFIFLDRRGKRFYSRRLNRRIKEACERAGIKKITCHKLRHTFASHLTMAGAPLRAVQELMGHSSIQTTMIYSHLSPSCLGNTISLLEPKIKSVELGQHLGNISFENKKTRKYSEALIIESPYLERSNR